MYYAPDEPLTTHLPPETVHRLSKDIVTAIETMFRTDGGKLIHINTVGFSEISPNVNKLHLTEVLTKQVNSLIDVSYRVDIQVSDVLTIRAVGMLRPKRLNSVKHWSPVIDHHTFNSSLHLTTYLFKQVMLDIVTSGEVKFYIEDKINPKTSMLVTLPLRELYEDYSDVCGQDLKTYNVIVPTGSILTKDMFERSNVYLTN